MPRPTWHGILEHLRDPFFRSSFLLIINGIIPAIIGLVFIRIISGLYPLEIVGETTTALSIIAAIGVISRVGFPYTALRFLPGRGQVEQRAFVGATMAWTGLASAVVATVALIVFMWESPIGAISQFAPAMIVCSIGIAATGYLDFVFAALRSAHLTLGKNVLDSLLRLGLPVLVVGLLPQSGILWAYAISTWVALIVAWTWLSRPTLLGRTPFLKLQLTPLQGSLGASFANYIVGVVWVGVPAIVNSLVLNSYGAPSATLLYLGLLVHGLLVTAPLSVSTPLLVEGARAPREFGKYLRKSMYFCYGLVLLAVGFVVWLGPAFIGLLVPGLRDVKPAVVQILAAAAIPAVSLHLHSSLLRVVKRNMELLLMWIVFAVLTVALVVLVVKFGGGLEDVAIAFVVAAASMNAYSIPRLIVVARTLHSQLGSPPSDVV